MLDFKELRKDIPIDTAVSMLGLEVKEKNGQLRGPCPIHNGENPRSFVITPSKGLWRCFGECDRGGDVIQLVADVRGISPKDAAAQLAAYAGYKPPPKEDKSERLDKVKEYIQPKHEAVQALGIEEDTARHFTIGWAGRGTLSGRVLFAVYASGGQLVGYAGYSPKAKDWKHGFDPSKHVYNAQNVTEGTLAVVSDPLRAVQEHQMGTENVCAFLTNPVPLSTLEALIQLAGERDVTEIQFL